VLEAAGAPIDQGRRQGVALRSEIESALHGVRARYGWLDWLGARRRAQRGPGRTLARYLPQQHERLQGIADAAHVPLAALELLETVQRVAGVGSAKAGQLEVSFDLHPDVMPFLLIRRSAPDAGGVPSLELTAAPWAGCLAGVNAEGIALACLEDRGLREPTLRLLAQDLLFRACALEPALDHLRRRAAYVGGAGLLLLVDAKGGALHAQLGAGGLRLEEAAAPGAMAAEPTLRIDAAQRTLLWRDAAGRAHEGQLTHG